MGSDVQWPLRWVQRCNDFQARLIYRALGLLGVLESDADLVAELRAFVLLQDLVWLSKVVFHQIEEGDIILFRDTGVVQHQGAIDNQSICSLINPLLKYVEARKLLDAYLLALSDYGLRICRTSAKDVKVDDGEIHRDFLTGHTAVKSGWKTVKNEST